jgi:hypothetical protein
MLPNGQVVIMKAPATITPGSRVATLTSGGQLVSSGGSQIYQFADGENYTIPGSGTITFRVNRSVNLPAGFLYPTAPASCPTGATMRLDGQCYNAANTVVPSIPPHMRLPAAIPQ